MKRNIRLMVFGAAFLGLGISMPSCPGQQAMQSQIEALQTKSTEATKQLQTMDSQVKHLGSELSQLRNIVSQLNNAMGAQKQSLDQITAALKAMSTKKVVAPKALPAKKKGR